MDKLTLVEKLTAETVKKYPLERLEEIYGCSGGKLMAAIFNEIYKTAELPSEDENPIPVFLEDIPRP